MKDRQELLAEIQEGLRSGELSEADLRAFITVPAPPTFTATAVAETKPDRLSVVDVMFYIAGVVFFSTIMSVIIQSWDDGNAFMHIALSGGIGLGLWALVYFLIKSEAQSDVRQGLTNALLLTGSLLLVVGGYIASNELIGGFGEVNYAAGAITLAVLGALHIGFDRLIKKDLALMMGILLSVAAFPALLFSFLDEANAPVDGWAFVTVLASGLLAFATRVVANINPDRQQLRSAFDSFAGFLGLLTMYVASYSEYGQLWTGVLIAAVFGIFYLSIITQNKHLLGNASFFLVLTVITISFKYFSGFGATASLIVATAGLLGTAAIASTINKKYFKHL